MLETLMLVGVSRPAFEFEWREPFIVGTGVEVAY